MVLSFGELLLRFAPDAEGKWMDKNAMDVYLGGAELNVATALATWRVPVSYCTVLPENFMAKKLVKFIQQKNIDVSTITYHGNKIGTYYLLKGTEIQHAEIIYDRAYSSFSDLKPGMIDWNNALNGIRWFHFSAISPALNENVAAALEEALQVCAKRGITISVDLNYRPKLWQYGKKSNEIMPQLVKHCDIVMGNIWSIETMLNIEVPKDIHEIKTKKNYVEQSKKSSEQLIQQFPKCKIVANTFRFDRNDIEYFATLHANNNFYSSASYTTNSVIDRVGSGDSFMAGLIYGIYNHLPFQQIINFASAAAFQKLFVQGDSIDKSVEEIKSFIQHHE